jgi:Immunity protein Imm1
MTLDVTWYVYHGDAPRTWGEMKVMTPEDVHALVAALQQPGVDDAYVTHLGRPTQVVPALGDEHLPDHVVHLTLEQGWGYFAFAGAAEGWPDGFSGSPQGDPRSPRVHGTYNTDYPAGSGLPLDVFERVVSQFLTTKELATCVRWVSDDDLRPAVSE